MGLKPRPRRTTAASEIENLVAAFAPIHATGYPRGSGRLRERAEQWLAAPKESAAKNWHSLSILLEDGQGGLYAAASPAAPLLLQLCRFETTPVREEVFPFLIFLALGYQKDWLARGCHRGQALAKKWFARAKKSHAIYKRLCDGLDVFIGALGDDDRDVRTAAAYAMAWFGEEAERVREASLTALSRERDPRARASLLLCLGLQGAYRKSDEDARCLAEYLDDDEQNVRIAAAYALMYLPGQPFADRVFHEVRAAHRTKAWPGFPWKIFREPWFDFGRERLMVFVEERRKEVIETLFEIMEAIEVEPPPSRGPAPQRPCNMAAIELRKLVFPPKLVEVTPKTITTEQKRFIACYLRAPNAFEWLSLGMPEDADELRVLIGEERERPPSVLLRELAVDGEAKPLRAHLETHGVSGLPPTEALCRAIVDALSPAEAIEALIDGARWDNRPSQNIAPRAGESGMPKDWPHGFPMVPGGELQTPHPAAVTTVLHAYGIAPDELVASYRTACERAGWTVYWEEPLHDSNYGHVHAQRDNQRVQLYWTLKGDKTELRTSRSWHLRTPLVEALVSRHGEAFLDALATHAKALVERGAHTKSNPNPGAHQLLEAATIACERLDVAPPQIFDKLAPLAQRSVQSKDQRRHFVAHYLELLPEPRRERLVLVLLDLDDRMDNVAGYARECQTPGVMKRVLERARKGGFARDLALAGPTIVPGLLAAARETENPRRVVFANTLSIMRPPPAAALLELLDDSDKHIREIAERGLKGASIEEIEPRARALLTDKKKPMRELGARLLVPLPQSELRRAIAAEALEHEKTQSVRSLLERIRE